MITVRIESIDSYGRGKSRKFKTLQGAQRFAQRAVGEHPEFGMGYAVSDDGVCKVECYGARLSDLFPSPGAAVAAVVTGDYRVESKWDGYDEIHIVWFGTRRLEAYDSLSEARAHIAMCREYNRLIEAGEIVPPEAYSQVVPPLDNDDMPF